MARDKTRRPASRRATTPSRTAVVAGIGRLISWHRRKLAVICAMAAAAAGITAASPPDQPTIPVVVAAHPLDGEAKVSDGDVTVHRVPAHVLPHRAVADTQDAVGRTLVAPIAEGAMLTKPDILGKSTVTHPGNVIAPVRIADSAIVKLLRVGDHVDVLASDPESENRAEVIAKHARVVTIPDTDDSGSGLGVGERDTHQRARLVLVEVSSAEATTLAKAASTSQLSVLLG